MSQDPSFSQPMEQPFKPPAANGGGSIMGLGVINRSGGRVGGMDHHRVADRHAVTSSAGSKRRCSSDTVNEQHEAAGVVDAQLRIGP